MTDAPTPTLACIVGHVIVDVLSRPERPVTRLGGVMHAARGFAAAGTPFVLAYIAPEYLDGHIRDEARALGAAQVVKVGNLTGCPNLLFVRDPTEAGDQGYFSPMWGERQTHLDLNELARLTQRHTFSDMLVLPEGFDLRAVLGVLRKTGAEMFIDVANGPADLSELDALGRPFTSVISSTSSESFLANGGDAAGFASSLIGPRATTVLVKENRGGSRLFALDPAREVAAAGAHLRPVLHSVGVGDCFDAIFISKRRTTGDAGALAYSALVAAEYAVTFDVNAFRSAAGEWFAMPEEQALTLEGVSLPWEARRRIPVYVAGPDFRGVDTSAIRNVTAALTYHNFPARLPVQEHGEVPHDAPVAHRRAARDADIRLLDECRIVVAVLPFDDPGTLIEIGIAVQRQMPVIVFDPYLRANNLMLTELPRLVTNDLASLVSEVFIAAAELSKAGKV